jgi:hypothetical protein
MHPLHKSPSLLQFNANCKSQPIRLDGYQSSSSVRMYSSMMSISLSFAC